MMHFQYATITRHRSEHDRNGILEHGIEQKGRWHLIFGIFGLVKHNQHQCRIRFPWKSKVVNQLWLFLIKMDFE